jgi:hypothetical protein
MSDKQQTAVEWLINELRKYGSPIPRQLEEQAKEMEKQQIIDAKMPKNLFGQIDQQEAINEAEQYFNDKFKSNGK